MTIREIIELESEQIQLLRYRSEQGDNEASKVLLEHLRAMCKAIDEWKKSKVADEKGNARKKREYILDPSKTKTT
jgi:hypothetical protein